MNYRIAQIAIISITLTACGQSEAPIDLSASAETDSSINLDTGDCGDGLIQLGESCDGVNVGAMTCEYLGFGPGELTCANNCVDFNVSGCGMPDFNAPSDSGECIASWIADGWCDSENNLAVCQYDGGDCCPSTCEDSYYLCGDYPFNCIDPQACEVTGECEPAPSSGSGTVDPAWCEAYEELCGYSYEEWCAAFPELCDVTYEEYCQWYPEFCDDIDDCEQYPELCDPNTTYCVPEWSGDNECDFYNNTAECGWDGGDCCISTVGIYSNSRSYECLDPDACENSEDFCPSRDSVFCETNPQYCFGYCIASPGQCCPEGESECPNSIVYARSDLTPESFVGVYERRPIENDWHLVEVVFEEGQLWWRNQAGVQWMLYFEEYYVRTGEDCPYGQQNLGLQLVGVGEDAYISELYGLRFNNSELYLRID